MLEHTHMARMRALHPNWIWNRSDTHVVLGVPGSHEAFKTPVEPGNSFSPGPGTYGVSTWVSVNGMLHTPEEKSLNELAWSFVEGHIPVLISKWRATTVHITSRLFTDGDPAMSDIKNYLSVELRNDGQKPLEFSFFMAIRSFGPAGGPIKRLAWINHAVVINEGSVLYPNEAPTRFGALSYAETKSDISETLKAGRFPEQQDVSDTSQWASGALEYRITLAAGETKKLDFVAHVHANHPKFKWLPAPTEVHTFIAKEQEFVTKWRAKFPIKLNLPDQRFTDGFLAQLTHLSMFTVADEPRISPISYPIWWLRDGAYLVTALDKGGFHQFAEAAVKKVAHRDAFGGFGSEGDGPAQGIWMLSEHYLLSGKLDFLREVYPHIERKAELIIKMLHTKTPIKQHTEFCIPQMMLNPETDLMCLAAEDGLIVGRMDLHFPLYWASSFAYLGLHRTALCAKALGLDGSRYEQEAERLKATLIRKAPELFGKNERDVNSAFWPTGWASREDKNVQAGFESYWNRTRCPGGKYTREPLWTYFEAGQGHNYMLLGQRDRALQTMEHFLGTHTSPGLYTYSEGKDDENSALLWQRTRGWDVINYVTPHGWTAAELFLFMRDSLAREDGDKLVIGSGIPESWMDNPFSVESMPTHFGRVSFHYDPKDKSLRVQVERPPAGGIISELPGAVRII